MQQYHDKTTLAVLCFFLGGFGVHRFIVGSLGIGLLELFLSLSAAVTGWWIIYIVNLFLLLGDFCSILRCDFPGMAPRMVEASKPVPLSEQIDKCGFRFKLYAILCAVFAAVTVSMILVFWEFSGGLFVTIVCTVVFLILAVRQHGELKKLEQIAANLDPQNEE